MTGTGPVEAVYPLSPMQEGLLFHTLLSPDAGEYFEQAAYTLHGDLNVEAFTAAWSRLLERHPILRTAFVWEGLSRPMQAVRRRLEPPLTVEDWSDVPPDRRQAKLEALLHRDRRRGFDLARAPLMRLLLVRWSETSWRFLWSHHHLLLDGWSLQILLGDLAVAYGALAAGEEPRLPPAPPFRDYVDWLGRQDTEAAEALWHRELAGLDATGRLDLGPAPPEPPPEDDYGRWEESLSPAATAALRDFARHVRLTPNTVLQGAWAVLLAHYQGADEVLFGATTSGRPAELPGAEEMLGLFVATLPVRTRVPADVSVDVWLRDLQARQAQVRRYEHVSLVRLRELAGRPAGQPWLDVVLAFESYPLDGLALTRLGDLTVEASPTLWERTSYPLTLQVAPGEGLLVRALFDRRRFADAAVGRLLRQLIRLLGAMVDDPARPLGELAILDAAERHQVLREWGAVAASPEPVRPLHESFEARARRRPDAVAVVRGGFHLTYGELDRRSARVARRLRESGVGVGDRVGLRVARRPELLVGLVGIVRAGAAYVPLDPSYPAARLREIETDAAPETVLDLGDLVAADAASEGRDPPRLPSVPVAAPVYVLYTSGSTGRPKGVVVSHAQVERLFAVTAEELAFTPNDCWSFFHSFAFDFSVWEIWGALRHGARLAMTPREATLSPRAFERWIREEGVTVLSLTPSAFRHLCAAGPGASEAGPHALRLVTFGGEALRPRDLDAWWDDPAAPRWINLYGITETTVHVTWRTLEPADARDPSSPIGRALPDLGLYLLDRRGRPVAPGAPGEIHVTGAGLASGYLGMPGQTASRFLPDPFADRAGARMYRTGDRARWRPDGELEFLGRVDDQVKIRGHRIEPGEVEAVLHRRPEVREAVVAARPGPDGAPRLVAWVAADEIDAGDADVETDEAVVRQWRSVFDDTYAEPAPDPAFDLAGWNSAVSGEAIDPEEMREWVEGTVERLRRGRPRRILEIGCGTGLLLFRLAAEVERYLATDVSAEVLRRLARETARRGLDVVELREAPAHDLGEVERDGFDLVILNSVVQYFPGPEYLDRVLEAAFERLAPGGRLFVGDVRNLALLDAFTATAELAAADPSRPVAQVRRAAELRAAEETELLVDPRYFSALGRRLATNARVRAEVRRGRAHNELTRFRYDAVVTRPEAGDGEVSGDAAELAWSSGRALDDLSRRLEQASGRLRVTGIPDARTRRAVRAAELLRELPGDAPAAEVERSLRRGDDTLGIEPEDLWALASEAGWEARVAPSAARPGTLDATFYRPGQGGASDPASDHLSAGAWTNRPLAAQASRRRARHLTTYLRSRLPEHMVPASVVLLPELPRTPQGKVDRSALPAPDGERSRSDLSFVPPRTPDERAVAEIFAEVLGLDRVGAEDDFFALGGHSLMATQALSRLRDRLGADLSLRALFEHSSVAALAARLQRGGTAPPPVEPGPPGPVAPLSYAQERLWFFHRLEPDSSVPHIAVALRLTGAPRGQAFAAAFTALTARHETLRTRFRTGDDGAPVQEVGDPGRPSIRRVDLRGLEPSVADRVARDLAREETRRTFDPGRPPLWRLAAVQLPAGDHLLWWTLHHLVADGWSLGVALRQVAKLYASALAGRPGPWTPPSLQYRDYVAWQRAWLTDERLAEGVEWWTDRLASTEPGPSLPYDRPPRGSRSRSGLGTTLGRTLDRSRAEALEALAREHDATLFMALWAVFQALLGRLGGDAGFPVGSPVAGRPRAELEDLVGLFVNTVVLCADVTGDPSVNELIRRAAADALAAFEHQEIPFERVAAAVRAAGGGGSEPLFRVFFVLQNAPLPALELPATRLVPQPLEGGHAAFELALSAAVDASGLHLSLEIDSDLFDRTTGRRMLEHLETLLAAVVADPATRLSALPLLGPSQRQALLREWPLGPDLRDASPVSADLYSLFARRAAQRPDAVAVVTDAVHLTYGELDRRASALAAALEGRGATPEARVAVCLDRGPELVIAILGVLATGAAYVPVEPDSPPDRLDYVLADAGVCATVTVDDMTGALGKTSSPSRNVDATNLAYVMYTSGSTGRPKGVGVTHANAVRLFAAARGAIEPGPDDVWSLFHSPAFDFSVWELWGALLHGGRLVVVPRWTTRNPEAFRDLVETQRVTVLSQTPSAFHALSAAEDRAEAPGRYALRRIVFGGEALEARHLSIWFDRHGDEDPALINMYGITETTVHVTWRRMRRAPDGRASISRGSPVGRPLTDLATYVLDRHRRPAPMGVAGEIHVAGAGLARGYLGRPGLTADRFVPHPWSPTPGARLYRTGDAARLRADGEIEHLGRTDDQVKIRGHRIEPGEVVAVLESHPAVDRAVVGARPGPDGEGRLVAWWVAGPGTVPGVEELRRHLSRRLPDPMVPAAFVALESLPTTTGGKVDRRALPDPGTDRPELEREYVAPRTVVEEELAGLWRELLKVDRVGVHDSFFELGGHSLLFVRLTTRIREHFAVDVPLRVLFDAPTLEQMTVAVAEHQLEAEAQEGDAENLNDLMAEIASLSDDEVRALLAEEDAP